MVKRLPARLAAALLLGVYLAWGWARAECLVLCVESDGRVEVQIGLDGACTSCAEETAPAARAAWRAAHGTECCRDGVLLGGDRDRLAVAVKTACSATPLAARAGRDGWPSAARDAALCARVARAVVPRAAWPPGQGDRVMRA